jgi:hypothetical protein
MARSTDGGLTWGSLITNPFGTDYIEALAYGNGVFVAGTIAGKCSRSLDLGLTWGITYGANNAAQTLGTYIYAIATNGNGRFVVGGYGTTYSIAYSDYVEAGAGIVESGSNSNGSWIKFDDGTMEQWVSLAATNGSSYSFAMPFTAAPIVLGTSNENSGTAQIVKVIPLSLTQYKVWMALVGGGGTNVTCSIYSYGSWK